MILVEMQHYEGDTAADVECGSIWWRANDLSADERAQIDRHAEARRAKGENGGNGMGELLCSLGFVRFEHREIKNGKVGRQFDGDDSDAEFALKALVRGKLEDPSFLRLVRGWPHERKT